MRFIRMMKRNTGTREKMWAGHTAPFFACRKVKPTFQKRKKARKVIPPTGEYIVRAFLGSYHINTPPRGVFFVLKYKSYTMI